MKAAAHTDIYRPFQGALRAHSVRFLPLAGAGIRTAAKRRLPMLLLFAPPAIATVIFSFVVYLRFAAEAGVTPEAMGGGGGGPGAMLVAGLARNLVRVRGQIVIFHLAMTAFTTLVIAWYGAGEIAEDRRLGASLLYFSRPMTVLDYALGKLLTVGFFAALAVLVPGLAICAVATFSSPEWSFLKQEGEVVPRSIGFGLLAVLAWSSVVLAISSLFRRKTFALVACFAFFLVPGAVSGMLAALLRDSRWLMLSLQGDFHRLAAWLFEMPRMGMSRAAAEAGPGLALLGIAVYTALAWVVLLARVRRMESVG